MASFRLSQQARESLEGIYAYSIETFGKRRAKHYLRTIQKKFQDLPDVIGVKSRDEINPGYMSIRVESHVVFFRIRNGQGEVLDVLHRRMDPSEHL